MLAIFRGKGLPLVACFWAGTVALFVLFGVLFFLSEHLETVHGIDGVPKGVTHHVAGAGHVGHVLCRRPLPAEAGGAC